MRIHSFIKVCFAALTIAFAVLMSAVHGSAQTPASPVSLPNVTQVQITCKYPNDISDKWCWTYDKIAPKRWVQRRNDGKTFPFVELPPTHDMIILSATSGDMTVLFNFGAMQGIVGMHRMKIQGRDRDSYGTITGIYEVGADNSPETCTQQTTGDRGTKCTCDLRTLRPLQGAVGMEEVRKKAKDIREEETRLGLAKTRLDLAYDPIKIVRGPDGLYVTDHHHGALAWLKAGHTMGTCQIHSDIISGHPTQFWADLKGGNLVWLKDKDGNPITEAQLQLLTTLEALPDDPYRTLAWRVRKGDKDVKGSEGFCRGLMKENKEFAEFRWADWLRKRPEFQNPPGPKGNWSDPKRAEAIALAKTPAASGLPGYRSDLSVACLPDPD